MPILVVSKPNDEDFVLEFSGIVDETHKFPQVRLSLAQRIIINCDKLKHMNSFAVQRWAAWMHSFDEQQQFVFRNVPPRIVDSFNKIDGLLPNDCTFESFYVPYECEECHHEENILATRGREFLEAQKHTPAKLLLPEEINCPKCKSGMKLGVWKEKYLRFLTGQPKSSRSE